MQVSFCDLHFAVLPTDMVQSRRRKYCLCVMVHRLYWPVFSGN